MRGAWTTTRTWQAWKTCVDVTMWPGYIQSINKSESIGCSSYDHIAWGLIFWQCKWVSELWFGDDKLLGECHTRHQYRSLVTLLHGINARCTCYVNGQVGVSNHRMDCYTWINKCRKHALLGNLTDNLAIMKKKDVWENIMEYDRDYMRKMIRLMKYWKKNQILQRIYSTFICMNSY